MNLFRTLSAVGLLALASAVHAAPIVVDISGASAVNNNNIFGGGSGSTNWAGQTVTLVDPLSLTLAAGDYTLAAAGALGRFQVFEAQIDYMYPHAYTNNFIVAVASATQTGQFDVLQHDHIAGDPANPYDYAWDTVAGAYAAFQGLSWNLHLGQSTTLYFAVASSFAYDQPDQTSGTSIVITEQGATTPGGNDVPEPPVWALMALAGAAAAAVRRKV